MNFKVIQRKNPQNLEMDGKFYPAPVYYTTIDLKSLANEISHSTSLTGSDVKAVIEELMIAFERHLINGEKNPSWRNRNFQSLLFGQRRRN